MEFFKFLSPKLEHIETTKSRPNYTHTYSFPSKPKSCVVASKLKTSIKVVILIVTFDI